MISSVRFIGGGIGLLALLSGCSSLGSKEYGCSGLPPGVRCKATSDVYEASHNGDGAGAAPAEHGKAAQKKDSKPATRTDQAPVQTDPVVDTFVTPNLPDRPVPIRTPARVMRIWIASWEDAASGALMAPGYVYTEIEPRRWVIGKPESAARATNRLFQPLDQTRVITAPVESGTPRTTPKTRTQDKE